MFEFTVYSAIQEQYMYKDIWENPVIGEDLKCQRDIVPSTTSYSILMIPLRQIKALQEADIL